MGVVTFQLALLDLEQVLVLGGAQVVQISNELSRTVVDAHRASFVHSPSSCVAVVRLLVHHPLLLYL